MKKLESQNSRRHINVTLDYSLGGFRPATNKPKLYGMKDVSSYELCMMQVSFDRVIRTKVTQQLKQHGLTMMQWLALGAISLGPKEGISMSQIGQKLGVTPPQITALVSELSSRELITQMPFAKDRRGKQVSATIKGKKFLAKLDGTIIETLHELTKNVSHEKMRLYADILKHLTD